MSESLYLELEDIIRTKESRGLIPVSRSTWLRGVKSGSFPQPVKIGRKNFWLTKEIHAFVEQSVVTREITIE